MQPDKTARRENAQVLLGIPEKVTIPGTDKVVSISAIKPYTIERLTELWLERESMPSDSSETLKSLCKEPYFAIKEALLFVLNDYFKIRFLMPFYLFWWKVKGYTEEQMTPIIEMGKKKIPLTAHWMNMALSVDMRMDWTNLTKEEAEQYRAELISAAERHSARNSQSSQGQEGSSSDS